LTLLSDSGVDCLRFLETGLDGIFGGFVVVVVVGFGVVVEEEQVEFEVEVG
jgi:hypothetical protein